MELWKLALIILLISIFKIFWQNEGYKNLKENENKEKNKEQIKEAKYEIK